METKLDSMDFAALFGEDADCTAQYALRETLVEVNFSNGKSTSLDKTHLMRIQGDQYLDDTLIAFYLNKHQSSNAWCKENVFVAPSQLYSRLCAEKNIPSNMEEFVKFLTDNSERLCEKVETWIPGDFFDKQIALFVINGANHWSLAAVKRINKAGSIPKYNLYHLDSSQIHNTQRIVCVMQMLLSHMYKLQVAKTDTLSLTDEKMLEESEHAQVELVLIHPDNLQKQNDTFNCGVFVLHYASEILVTKGGVLKARTTTKFSTLNPRTSRDEMYEGLLALPQVKEQ